jgi:hypothetical protein
MQQQRNGLARLIVDPIEGLRRLAPGLGIENVSQRLLCAVQRVPIAVIQPIVLKQGFDLEQLDHNRVACHAGRIDDSTAQKGRSLQRAQSHRGGGRDGWARPLRPDGSLLRGEAFVGNLIR